MGIWYRGCTVSCWYHRTVSTAHHYNRVSLTEQVQSTAIDYSFENRRIVYTSQQDDTELKTTRVRESNRQQTRTNMQQFYSLQKTQRMLDNETVSNHPYILSIVKTTTTTTTTVVVIDRRIEYCDFHRFVISPLLHIHQHILP